MKGIFAAACALTAVGCIARSTPETIEYYRILAPERAPSRAAAANGALVLRLRHVEGAGHLGARLAARTSDVAVGFNDLVRWTEPPAAFVERSLARELFEVRGLRRSDASTAPELRVEVRAFEEDLGASRTAHVAVWVLLFDARGTALVERTFTARRPVAADGCAPLARALGDALEQVSEEIGGAVAGALAAAAK